MLLRFVHRSLIKANLRRHGVKGKKNLDEVRKFGTMTRDLLSLGDWLKDAGCTNIAMESTGVFWKPIFNVLGSDFEIILVNSRHYTGPKVPIYLHTIGELHVEEAKREPLLR